MCTKPWNTSIVREERKEDGTHKIKKDKGRVQSNGRIVRLGTLFWKVYGLCAFYSQGKRNGCVSKVKKTEIESKVKVTSTSY